jgi:hypothetical protein
LATLAFVQGLKELGYADGVYVDIVYTRRRGNEHGEQRPHRHASEAGKTSPLCPQSQTT